jgi:hypothetical protein
MTDELVEELRSATTFVTARTEKQGDDHYVIVRWGVADKPGGPFHMETKRFGPFKEDRAGRLRQKFRDGFFNWAM